MSTELLTAAAAVAPVTGIAATVTAVTAPSWVVAHELCRYAGTVAAGTNTLAENLVADAATLPLSVSGEMNTGTKEVTPFTTRDTTV